MLEFGYMYMEGFGPFKGQSFNWGKKGLSIIQAPNGTGKSKLVNALVWALYGKVLSGSVEMWEHLRDDDYKGVMVELIFYKHGTEYQVIRCKGYKGLIDGAKGKNRLIVKEDGEEIEADDKNDMKSELQSILGYGFELFKNTIIFGQKLKRLVNESGPKKKQILDEAFEVMYISKANKLASEKQKEKAEELKDAENQLNLIQNNRDNAYDNLEREKKRIENFEDDKAKEIESLKAERKDTRFEYRLLKKDISKLKPKKDIVEEKVKEKSKLIIDKDKYSDSQTYMGTESYKKEQLEKAILGILNQINKIKEDIKNIPESCSECGHKFTVKEKREEKKRLENKLEELEKEYAKEIDNLSKINSVIKELKIDISSANSIQESIDNISKEIKSLEKEIKDLPSMESDLRNLKKDINKLTTQISEKTQMSPKNYIEKFTRTLSDLESELESKTEQVKLIKRDYEDYGWLIKEPLSNSGLKAYIFDQLLENINERLEYYTKFSGLTIGFTIDMESSRKDLITWISNNDHFVNYDELSGGQQQKVDIVIIFAIHDVVSDTKECSLMVMDELFESLDQENISLLTELIMDKAKDKCLYLITHRTEFNPTNSNTIQLLNVNGFTSIM